MTTALYIDTSAILSAVLETGLRPDVEQRIGAATALLTSRLSLVEAARAVIRIRNTTNVSEARLADVARHLDALWARCEIWEVTSDVCDLASTIAPARSLRTLDALHVATYLIARRRLGDVELLTADARMKDAVGEPR